MRREFTSNINLWATAKDTEQNIGIQKNPNSLNSSLGTLRLITISAIN